jgi:hypothetical protein
VESFVITKCAAPVIRSTKTMNKTKKPNERKNMNNKLDNLTKILKPTPVLGTIALALCFLVQPAVASPGNPVPRPVKVIEGHLTITINPQTGAYQFTDWAWASHVGLSTNSGAGFLDLPTGTFISGTGVVIAANGDALTWEVGTTPNTIVYTGGTGRFEGATGSLAVVVTSQTLLSINDDGTLTFLMTYTGEGTITY